MDGYKRTMGSGWFWIKPKQGDWFVAYVNSLWGVSVNGKYVRPDSFEMFEGPIFPPMPTVTRPENIIPFRNLDDCAVPPC